MAGGREATRTVEQGSVNHGRFTFINHMKAFRALSGPRHSRHGRKGVVMAALAIGLCAASAYAAGEGDDPGDFGLRSTLSLSGKGGRVVAQSDVRAYGAAPDTAAGDTGYISSGERSGRPKKSKKAKKKEVIAPEMVLRPAPVAETRPGQKMNPRIGTITPPQHAPKKPVDDDPFGPVGVHAGAFLLKPSIEISQGYDDNPFRVQNGPGSAFTVLKSQLSGKSEWSRHELSFDLRGSYTTFENVDHNDRPDASALVRERIDVAKDLRFELEQRAALSTQSAGTPDAVTGAKRPPLIYTLGTSAGVVKQFNRLEVGLYGSAERTIYENADLLSGGTLDLSDSTYNDYTVRLRGGYEITPGIKPFVEAAVDTRVFDHEIDSFGIRQGSDGYRMEAGIAFDRPEIIKGQLGLGVIGRNYDDPTLPNISGLLVDSSLVWKASALTTVSLNVNTSIGESTTTGAAGIFTREGKLTVDHSFRRWLIGSLFASYGQDQYRGTDRVDERTSYGAALTYSLNRALALRGEIRRDQLNSNVPGQDYTANVALLGLRLQR